MLSASLSNQFDKWQIININKTMVSRMCAYKNCDNFYHLRLHDNAARNVTLFAFPKQPDRAKLWRELAAVHPKMAEPLYMCSKHFDPKYIAKSNTRSKLVGEAVPYAYEEALKEIEVETTSSSQENYYINMVGSDEEEININTVESTTTNSIFETDKYELVAPEDNEINVSLVPPSRKRMRSPSQSKPAATIEVELPASVPAQGPSNSTLHNAQTVDDVDLVDSNEVSTFNFKGEKYVQMSLDYYLREKRTMLQLLESYTNALRNIKSQVAGLDL